MRTPWSRLTATCRLVALVLAGALVVSMLGGCSTVSGGRKSESATEMTSAPRSTAPTTVATTTTTTTTIPPEETTYLALTESLTPNAPIRRDPVGHAKAVCADQGVLWTNEEAMGFMPEITRAAIAWKCPERLPEIDDKIARATAKKNMERALGSEVEARSMCEQFVSDRLKSPATAEFQIRTAVLEGSTWTVSGFVDSQNSYGALIRSEFTCSMQKKDAVTWHLSNLDLE